MKNKHRAALILGIAPLAAIAIYYTSANKEQAQQHSSAPIAVQDPGKISRLLVKSQAGTIPIAALDDFIKRSEDARTESFYEAAKREAAVDFNKHQSNLPHLLEKHRGIFDKFNVSESKRIQIATEIDKYTLELSKAFRDSAVSWPLAVGHASNLKASGEHSKALIKKGQNLLQSLRDTIGQIAGNEFTVEFINLNYSLTKSEARDD